MAAATAEARKEDDDLRDEPRILIDFIRDLRNEWLRKERESHLTCSACKEIHRKTPECLFLKSLAFLHRRLEAASTTFVFELGAASD
jgi:hypothetical protein